MRRSRLFIKMAGKSRKLHIAKYLFFALMVTCMTVVIALLSFSDKSSQDASWEIDDLNYATLSLPQFSEDMLDLNFEECFRSHFSHSVSSDTNYTWRKNFLSKENSTRNLSNHIEKFKLHPLISTVLEFTEIAWQFEMETVVIEPSILFCVLSPELKALLLKRNFKLKNVTSDHIITMGILQKYAVILETEEMQEFLEDSGFQTEIVKFPSLIWMKQTNSPNSSLLTSHVFLKQQNRTIHLVVFHERSNYLWHASLLSQSELKIISGEKLHFVESEAAFDNFSAVSLGFKFNHLKNINIPSSPVNFLHQIETSRFLECNKTVVDSFKNFPSSDLPSAHSSLSVSRFNQRLIIAMEELKFKLDPLLLRFWIWSGTMLGWHRQCDVIPYTSDADFAAWASDVDDLELLIKTFIQNDHLEIKQKMGMEDEGLEFNLNCHGLRVDLFFVYKEDNGTWYAGHSPKTGNFFKYHHPHFSLCSADLLGHKVLVPCETESVIAAEYGSEWMHPISSWSYERSAKNKGPDIFWEKSLLKKVYVDF